jgi:hypothetical protein
VFWNNDTAAVRIEEELSGIKAKTTLWIERPVNSEAVNLARRNAWYEHMPIVIHAVDSGIDGDDAGGVFIILSIEEQ